MTTLLYAAGFVSFLLLIYLFVALLFPEKLS
mgnify:CR=1 FL=1